MCLRVPRRRGLPSRDVALAGAAGEAVHAEAAGGPLRIGQDRPERVGSSQMIPDPL